MHKQKVKILLIEDSGRDQLIIRRYLELIEAWDAQLFTASTPTEGRKILVEEPIEVIFLDQRLGDVSGLDVLKQMRDSGINLPVILVTGMAEESLPSRLIHAGGDDYLSKDTLDAEIIRDAVDFVLEGYEETKQKERRAADLEQQAKTDELTGLLGRRYLTAQLREIIEWSEANDESLYFFMIDLDNFKLVNDELGHITGDQVLADLGAVLSQFQDKKSFVGRYGGDEFCLFRLGSEFDEVLNLAQLISQRSFQALEDIIGKRLCGEFEAGCTIGVAGHRPGQSHKQFIERADQALRKAKANGKNCIGLMADSAVSDESADPVELILPDHIKLARERKFTRHRINDLPVLVKFEGKTVSGRLQEVSCEGLKVTCDGDIPPAAELQVLPQEKQPGVELPDSLEGTVRWKKTELGVELNSSVVSDR